MRLRKDEYPPWELARATAKALPWSGCPAPVVRDAWQYPGNVFAFLFDVYNLHNKCIRQTVEYVGRDSGFERSLWYPKEEMTIADLEMIDNAALLHPAFERGENGLLTDNVVRYAALELNRYEVITNPSDGSVPGSWNKVFFVQRSGHQWVVEPVYAETS